MAEIASGAIVIANGRDLSVAFKGIDVSASRDAHDSTGLYQASRNYTPGLATREVSGEGFWATDTTTDTLGLDRVFSDLQESASQMIFSLGQGGAASGDNAILMTPFQSELNIDDITPGELKMMQFSATASGNADNTEWQRGIWLFSPETANTGATNGTSYDSTAGGTGWLAHVHVVDGDGNATVQIEHSTDDAVWADLSNASYAVNTGTQVSDTDDAVNRYLRVTVTPVATTCTVGVSLKLGYTG